MTGDFDPQARTFISRQHCVLRPKPFDSSEAARDQRAHPDKYMRWDTLLKQMAATAPLRAAKSIVELRKTYTAAMKEAEGDEDLREYLTEVKDKKKGDLTK